jgi:hypothetical protein
MAVAILVNPAEKDLFHSRNEGRLFHNINYLYALGNVQHSVTSYIHIPRRKPASSTRALPVHASRLRNSRAVPENRLDAGRHPG